MKSLFIAGNWKSNKTTQEAHQWIAAFQAAGSTPVAQENVTTVLCVPFTILAVLKWAVETNKLPFHLAAQNVSKFSEGAYTGEVSARQVAELAQWVIIGHSERRKYFGETDEDLALKVEKAKEASLRVIYCVPDAKTAIAAGVDVVAYEPVWAIGTGKTDTPENAGMVCGEIKQKVPDAQVIYGGSVTDENVASFVAQSTIDGVLPGGASLDPVKFSRLILAARTVV